MNPVGPTIVRPIPAVSGRPPGGYAQRYYPEFAMSDDNDHDHDCGDDCDHDHDAARARWAIGAPYAAQETPTVVVRRRARPAGRDLAVSDLSPPPPAPTSGP